MTDKTTKRILGPFNRVEGDLEVKVEVQNDRVTKAWVNSPLFRGFEHMLKNKDPRDALVYTPRICGICSVSQSVAAAQALAATQNIKATINGQFATNLILAAENMADHLSHFYLFFMPDFARDCYAHLPWFETVHKRFKAQIGTATKTVLPARANLLHITGILAGKWPHSLAIQPGGTTRPIEAQEKIKLLTIIRGFRLFLEETLFDDSLENINALKTSDDLQEWRKQHTDADFSLFLSISDSLKLSALGQGVDSFMSFGAYQHDDKHLFRTGTWQQKFMQLDTQMITEDVSHSWMNEGELAVHPFDGRTNPDANEEHGYSWCKAPRLNKKVMEVGAIARQMVAGQPLIQNLVKENGTNVHSRIVARMLELALVVPEMENWCQALEVKAPFCTTATLPKNAQGFGLVEAARGSLGHWLKIKNGKIENYQIIAPTTWNFSPRDVNGAAGALEQALQNTYVGEENKTSVAIQHIIRSFDPCMVCTVH